LCLARRAISCSFLDFGSLEFMSVSHIEFALAYRLLGKPSW